MQPVNPIMVRIVEPAVKGTTVADVLIGTFGLIGVLLVCALALGATLGGVLILIKRLRARYDLEPVPEGEALRVTPEFVKIEQTGTPRRPRTRKSVTPGTPPGLQSYS